MGASTEDMINQLQGQLATPPQPSLFGVQAPPDPQGLQALLQRLKQQQYLERARQPTGGAFGYLHDAGQAGFADVGQQLGAAAGGAMTATPQGAAPPPTSPQAAMSAAVQAAQRIYKQVLTGGGTENQARKAAATAMVQAGIPGAADVLQKANDEGDAADFKKAETNKDNSQAAMDADNINVHKREQAQNTWADVPQYSNAEYRVQKNALGEYRSTKISDKASLPPSAQDASDMNDNAKKVANYQMSISDFIARKSGAERQEALKAVYAANPDYNAGNYTGSQAAYKAFTSGKLGDSARFATNVAAHSLALEQASDALQKGDIPAANAIAQAVGKQTGDPTITSYEVLQDIVAKEGVKALVPNAGSGKEREAAEARYKASLAGGQLKANTAQLRAAVGVQYNNLKNQYEQTTYRKNFGDIYKWPGADENGNAPLHGSTAQQQQAPQAPPAKNPQGWALHKDAKGNLAYVSPDGKQFQQVGQ